MPEGVFVVLYVYKHVVGILCLWYQIVCVYQISPPIMLPLPSYTYNYLPIIMHGLTLFFVDITRNAMFTKYLI